MAYGIVVVENPYVTDVVGFFVQQFDGLVIVIETYYFLQLLVRLMKFDTYILMMFRPVLIIVCSVFCVIGI